MLEKRIVYKVPSEVKKLSMPIQDLVLPLMPLQQERKVRNLSIVSCGKDTALRWEEYTETIITILIKKT